MKKIILLIALLSTLAFSMEYSDCPQTTSMSCHSAVAQEKMAKSFERIATALEKIAAESSRQNKQLMAIRDPEFQRSLKAVPTDHAVENSSSGVDSCIDKCWYLPLNSQIKPCVEKCVKSYR